MAGLGDKIADKALDYGIGAAIWFGGTVIPGLLGTPRFQDPFYHAGWIQENNAWLILFFILWIVSLCAVLRMLGLAVVTVVAVASAIIFGVFYGGSSSLSEGMQVALWVDHGVAYSVIPGAVAGWVVMALKWTGVL